MTAPKRPSVDPTRTPEQLARQAKELLPYLLAELTKLAARAAESTSYSSRKGCGPGGYSARDWRRIAAQIGTKRGRWYFVTADELAGYEAGRRPAVARLEASSSSWSPSSVAARLGLRIVGGQ